jgi:pilus assembly protein CpaB
MRLVFVGLMLITALALGMIAYQVARPPSPATLANQAPGPVPTLSYLVAAHPLPPGTLERDTDLTVKTVPREQLPTGAIIDTPAGRASLTGALIQHYVEPGMPLVLADVLRPRDRGFLAAVLSPGSRAVSIAVDPVSGVGGLIWPGDRVDVILTQEIPGTSAAKHVVGETVLTDVRIVAVDQDIVQGGSPTAGISGRLASTVTVQASEDQAERLTVAGRLGRLSLAIRAIGNMPSRGGGALPPMITGEDVSPALSQASGIPPSHVEVIQGDQHSEVTFR